MNFIPKLWKNTKRRPDIMRVASPVSGSVLIDAIEHAIQRIVDKTEQWKPLEKDVRRYLTRVFPYSILYSIEADYILLLAVMHCHREPGYWKNRIR